MANHRFPSELLAPKSREKHPRRGTAILKVSGSDFPKVLFRRNLISQSELFNNADSFFVSFLKSLWRDHGF